MVSRGDGGGVGEEYLRFLVAHAAGEIAVRGADTLEARLFEVAKRIHGTAEARGAAGGFRLAHPGTIQVCLGRSSPESALFKLSVTSSRAAQLCR